MSKGKTLHEANHHFGRDNSLFPARMVDLLGKEYKLDPQLAYALCSVAVDLRISEGVDAPNWVVSAYLPKAVFR